MLPSYAHREIHHHILTVVFLGSLLIFLSLAKLPSAFAQSVVSTTVFDPPSITNNVAPSCAAVVQNTGLVYVGAYGRGSAYDSRNVSFGRVGAYGGGKVGVIDPSTGTVVAVIPVTADTLSYSRVNQSKGLLYAFTTFGTEIVVIDGRPDSATFNKALPSLSFSGYRIDFFDIDEIHSRLYAMIDDYNSTSTSRPPKIVVVDIDPASATFHEVLNSIALPFFPPSGVGSMAVNAQTNKLYVAVPAGTGAGVYVLNGATLALTSIDGTAQTRSVIVNEKANLVYAGAGSNLNAIDGQNDSVLKIINLPDRVYLGQMAVNSISGRVYLTGWTPDITSQQLLVVDGKRSSSTFNTLVATMGLNNDAEEIMVDEGLNRIATTSSFFKNTNVIDGSNNALVSTIRSTQFPSGLALNPLTHRLYVANIYNFVQEIDLKTSSLSKTILTAASATGGVVEPGVGSDGLYYAGRMLDTADVVVFGKDGKVGEVTGFPHGAGQYGAFAQNSVTKRVYALNTGSNLAGDNDVTRFVSVIDGVSNTVIANVPVGSYAGVVAVNEATNKIYVGNNADVTVIDGATNTAINATISFFRYRPFFTAITINQVTNKAYLIYRNEIAPALALLDGATNIVTTLGGEPSPDRYPDTALIAVDQRRNLFYEAYAFDGNYPPGVVVVFDGTNNKGLRSITLGYSITDMTVDESNGRVYVGVDGRVAVIDSNGLVAKTPLPASNNTAVAVNELTNHVYVGDKSTGVLSILDGNTLALIGSLKLPLKPGSLAVDAFSSRVYVSTGFGDPLSGVMVVADLVLHGRVTDENGHGRGGVLVTLSGTQSSVTHTDANGDYSFPNLVLGGNYTVTPQSSYFGFTPSPPVITNLQRSRTADFSASANSVALPAPPLSDDFNGPTRDPAKWNLGTATQAPAALDSLVTVAQQNGQLVLTPRAGVDGFHYNGYVSVNSFDLTGGDARVELVQAATGGADTIFAIARDSDNFFRFMVRTSGQTATGAQLMLQTKTGGTLAQTSIPYDPVQDRFLRFRYEYPTADKPFGAIAFETSPDAVTWTVQKEALLSASLSTMTAELSAGTSSAVNNPGSAVFDNFSIETSTFQFAEASYSVSKNGGSITITVTRTGTMNGPATVQYSTVGRTASNASNFTEGFGTLQFPSGTSSATFTVLITDNGYAEGNKVVDLYLSRPTGAGLNSPARASLTIIDNNSVPRPANPVDDPMDFVRQHYSDFLNRAPDQSGFDYWTNQFTHCGGDAGCIRNKRIDVSNAFFFEQEYQQTAAYVFRLYRAAYGNSQPFPNPDASDATNAKKLPSYAVFAPNRARVIGGTGLAQSQLDLANDFVKRPEFIAQYPSNMTAGQFVDAILATIKSASGADLSSQRDALVTLFGQTGGQGGAGAVLYRLADDNMQTNPINNRALIDAEYNRAFVASQYFGYLRRDADIAGFNFWLGQVSSAPLRDVSKQHAMVCSFITSAEYQNRFSAVLSHSNSECPR